MRAFLAFIAWISLLAPALAADAIAVVPYRVDYGGWITVEVTIDGEGPYDFVIDTGSTLTVVFRNLADAKPFAPTGAPPLRVLGITAAEELDTYHIGDVAVGPAQLDDHIGAILEDWAPPRRTPHGILGLDFLERYAVYFSRDERVMTLYPHGGIPEERLKKLSRITLTPNNYGAASGALYTARGLVNRKPTTFIVDLGSASTLINYEAAEAIFSSVVIGNTADGFTTGSRLRDVFDDRTRARTALLNKIQLGRVTWRNHGAWVFNAPLFDEINVQRLPYGLAGVDLFADRDFALDFGENEMHVARRGRRPR